VGCPLLGAAGVVAEEGPEDEEGAQERAEAAPGAPRGAAVEAAVVEDDVPDVEK
jgi:hypothetical protein